MLGVARAQAQTPPQTFQPPPDSFDWIQLKSGEWLKGEIIALYDGKLEFDSDELKKPTFDWDDIRQVRTGRVMQIRFNDCAPSQASSSSTPRPSEFSGDTEQKFDRAGIISITPGEPREANYWSADATFGFNLRRGNYSRSR